MASRILIAGGGTGGHLVPALNLAAALRRAEPACELLLVGAERGIESRVLPNSGFAYQLLPMQPLARRRPWRNWQLLTSTPAVFRGVSAIFRNFRPDVAVGTGGYAAAPALAYAIAARRPTALQEQNAWPGLVTRLLAPHVDQVHLGYPEAASRLKPGRETEIHAHGNPVALPASADAASSKSHEFDWPAGKIVLVTGGSQGARALNEMLLRDLSATGAWPSATTLVWITGPAHEEAVTSAVRSTPWADRIRVVPWIDGLGAQLDRVDLAIARAGAMFSAELAAVGVPALLVPLPSAAGDHQRHNARALEDAGAALVFEQGNTAPGALWAAVVEVLGAPAKHQAMANRMAERGRPDAADRIVADLLALAARGRGGSHADD
ncbi:MAG TPA: UDP-N-acetylglucosamine--N-acetylmuramyl-(pentapeptide) pyrophosphoryl-undecaprenol N-acetylglucosamine transferase [Gemmatimonadota bacterium]|nr:UDP-N-acetylglucosamine--N-acetylmuramyl-(pentapeptide) pyrophosphoryl-undecaprenol N-acetylglucosamine transferase [Gemmatimonadota bacterium]